MSLMSGMTRPNQQLVLGEERAALTAFVSFDHQLVDRFQLGVVKVAHFLGLDVRHVHGACVLEVLEGLGDEQAEHFQVCGLDCVEDFQAFGSEDLGQWIV